MATYAVINSTERDLDSPVKENLLERIDQNYLAILEGDTSAKTLGKKVFVDNGGQMALINDIDASQDGYFLLYDEDNDNFTFRKAFYGLPTMSSDVDSGITTQDLWVTLMSFDKSQTGRQIIEAQFSTFGITGGGTRHLNNVSLFLHTSFGAVEYANWTVETRSTTSNDGLDTVSSGSFGQIRFRIDSTHTYLEYNQDGTSYPTTNQIMCTAMRVL